MRSSGCGLRSDSELGARKKSRIISHRGTEAQRGRGRVVSAGRLMIHHVLPTYSRVLIIAAILLGCYCAAYVLTVKAVTLDFGTGTGPGIRIPIYSVDGRSAERFFYPANAVDRWVRQEYWRVHDGDEKYP